MTAIHISVASKIVTTPRVKQLSGMFDVPLRQKLTQQWDGEIPLDEKPWNVGCIVGPSGAGKSTVARHLFGEPRVNRWIKASVVDDFAARLSIEDIAAVCGAVGFNTIPAWTKPYGVLSTGERFRVDLARHLIEGGDRIVIDEFTSVVDRQVAQIGSHAVQKYIRKRGKQFVGVTCHYDVIDWLQPDWMLEPATMTFQWRLLQQRPAIAIEMARVDHEAWQLFAPYHYLTAELSNSAACYVLFVEGVPASFVGILHRPHARVHNIKGVSRVVTLPDYQGLGLGMILTETLGAAHMAMGNRLHHYPAHPALVRALDRSPCWALLKMPGTYQPTTGRTSTQRDINKRRPCAVFEYRGKAMDRKRAQALISGEDSGQKKSPLRAPVRAA